MNEFFSQKVALMKTMARVMTMELGKTSKRDDWRGANYGIEPNAGYKPAGNKMSLPYQALDGWWFDAERPEVLNIATLGLGVNHEITHGFDNQGSLYDHEGLILLNSHIMGMLWSEVLMSFEASFFSVSFIY